MKILLTNKRKSFHLHENDFPIILMPCLQETKSKLTFVFLSSSYHGRLQVTMENENKNDYINLFILQCTLQITHVCSCLYKMCCHTFTWYK